VPRRVQWLTRLSFSERSIRIGLFYRRTGASDVFCRTGSIATAASAARSARTSDSILT